MTWLRLLPMWFWGLAAALLVASVQQGRVLRLQGDLRAAQGDVKQFNELLVACRVSRSNLLVQMSEQDSAMADLREAERQRQEKVRATQDAAREQARQDYKVANRLQQERIGGDACAASAAVIDQELGL